MIRKLQKQQIAEFLGIKRAPFKILIMDEHTRSILAPLFKLSELRDCGICAHYTLSNTRTQARDIPALYYIHDFNLVTQDVCRFIYSEYYINSSTQIKRAELENLAAKTSELQQANRIIAVNDTFTDFISLQNDLFSFNLKNSYLNDYTREVTSGLFSVFVTLNEMPFVVANPKTTGIRSSILKMFDSKLRNSKMFKNALQRPLCVIVERDVDLLTPLMHTLGFYELISDLFDVELNKVNLDGKSVPIDTESEFFNKQRFNDFVDVVDLINQEVQAYKKEMAMRNLSVTDVAKMLEVAPELQKKNEVVTSLLNISLNAVSEIKKRSFDEFYAMENKFDKNSLYELSEKGTNEDIIRLAVSMLGKPEAEFIGPMLEKRGIRTNIVGYIKKFMNEDKYYQTIAKKMKNLLFKKSLPVVAHVEDVLFRIKNSSLKESYETSTHKDAFYYNEISKVVVFVNGGISYQEVSGLHELSQKYGLDFIIGGTEIINARGFMSQLEQCE
ncbi:SLY1 [Enterospora canceri]|uniref:SLY1 n=1 Tax=Enterospora canceri TaxID=1081671 RepID=A0A1Y1S8I1_9MICR|nr:SLY1 [Enterospora canceri]